jgi:hypothetical protein
VTLVDSLDGSGSLFYKGKRRVARQCASTWLTSTSAVTFVVAVASAFILPNDPLQTWWLSPEERELANSRIVADTVGAKHQTSSWKGLKEAGKDPKIWLFAFMQHMHLAANGFKNFFPTAVETLGFSQTITL